MQKLIFDNEEIIFEFVVNQDKVRDISKYGNSTNTNLLNIFLTNSYEITSLILCDLEEYTENNCELIIDSDPIILSKEVTRARFAPEWADPGHRSDFKFYIDHNDIIIKFNDNETDDIIVEGRMDVGYDEQNNPTFIRIKNLTEEEYSQLIQRLEEKEVPMKI